MTIQRLMPSENRLLLCREAEANAYLSLTLTLASMLLLFVTRKLALTLSEREQLRVSQGAVLKQVSPALPSPFLLCRALLCRATALPRYTVFFCVALRWW